MERTMKMTYLFSILTGVISGIISSALIFVFWQFQKPKLEISKEIAKNSKGEYRVKIRNKTHRYVSKIFIQLQVVKRTNGYEGYVFNTYNLDLPYSEIMLINPRRKQDEKADHAIRLVLPNDLEKQWTEDQYTYLKLNIYCSNEYGTASKVYEQCYLRKNVIIAGEFECGDSMKIHPNK